MGADAPTTDAAPDATASPEALDAAAAAATTGAGAPPPAPAPASEPATSPTDGSGAGAPSVQDFVDDDGLDLASSGLPEATQEEIKKLRREVRGVKDVARSWQQATEGWHESDIELLRTALVQGRQDPAAVGEWMVNQAKTLLGDRFAELVGGAPAAEDEPQVGDPDGKGGALTAADVERLVNERLEAERHERRIADQVKVLRQQTEDLGFGPAHPLHYALLSIAKTQTNGNLAAAAEQLRSGLTEVDPNTADSQPGAGGHPQPGAGHTPVAADGGTPAGTKRPESPRAAAEERLARVLGNARGFNDLR